MLDRVDVFGYKGIKNGLVDHLTQITIIIGKNNAGKSAFLESLYLFNKEHKKT